MKNVLFSTLFVLVTGALVFNACKKDDDIVLPPIGGFANSNEVGANDLLAHFPCEDGKERITGTAPSESKNVTYGTGRKGKGAILAEGFLAYPPMASLATSTGSYSMSAWVKIRNNKNSATMYASIARPGEWAGHFNLMSETGWFSATSDTLVAKGLLISNEGTPSSLSWQDSRNEPAKGGDQVFLGASDTAWTHLVITWDATSNLFLVYGNNKKISNPEWELRPGVGDLAFNSATNRMVLGAFNTNTASGGGTAEAWQKPMKGSIDEVRVWKKALSPAEIDALYQLEKAGR
jgi:hypothetical protein